jgi:hypothetical protein
MLPSTWGPVHAFQARCRKQTGRNVVKTESLQNILICNEIINQEAFFVLAIQTDFL